MAGTSNPKTSHWLIAAGIFPVWMVAIGVGAVVMLFCGVRR